MGGRSRLLISILIVFVSSACSLIIELVAGRIMAPHIGVSLYTWTSIIGVVLAGISIGNYVGGRVADRWASGMTLALVFFAGALSTLGILVATEYVASNRLFTEWTLILRIVGSTAIIFFLPSLILGMVSPLVVKLTLQKIENAGNVVGTIYAFSTAGSIFGTFITGFYLISAFGTRTIVWGVAAILLVMGLSTGLLWRGASRARLATTATAGLLVLGTIAALYGNRDLYRGPCLRETNYFCIQIHETKVDGHEVRALVLDHLIHAYISLTDKTFIGYGYERVYAELTDYLTSEKAEFHTLAIGGGGYTFPMYLEAKYPNAAIDVIEIDPGVTEIAHEHLGLARDTRIQTTNFDARLVLRSWTDEGQRDKYDIIYGDAFNDLSIPYHLTTRQVDEMVYQLLKDDGYYLANVIDNMHTGEFLRAYMNTLREVFPSVQLFTQGNAWEYEGQNTYVVVAGNRPIDFDEFEAFVRQKNGNVYSDVMPRADLEQYLAAGQQIILDDDYAPVDQLVARLFVERGY